MRITDMFLALPQLPLLLVTIFLLRDTLRAAFGPEAGIFMLIVFVIGILNWMATARVVRAEVLSIKEQEFIVAARSIGTRQYRIHSPSHISQCTQPNHGCGHIGDCWSDHQ